MERTELDCAVVGGGLFGAWLALALAREQNARVTLVEREAGLLRRASYNNQARVHNGCHYPRSILTGLRSRVNSGRFLREYEDCIETGFTQLYAVARQRSNVTAAQFRAFCERIGVRLTAPGKERLALFDPERVEAVWSTEEWAFDAARLAARLEGELARARVPVLTGCEAQRVRPARAGGRRLELELRGPDGEERVLAADHVFNCTYSALNGLLTRSGLPKVALKQELAEIALVELPRALAGLGVTVMCGPFFSFMPFPARGLSSLSHVRYTPHHAWLDREQDFDNQPTSPRCGRARTSRPCSRTRSATCRRWRAAGTWSRCSSSRRSCRRASTTTAGRSCSCATRAARPGLRARRQGGQRVRPRARADGALRARGGGMTAANYFVSVVVPMHDDGDVLEASRRSCSGSCARAG
jgi:glycine/D-amino acid oxidase-like deaminating enzyme